MRPSLLAVLLAAATGCNFVSFFDQEDDAPVHVIEKPSGFVPGSFGSALAAMTGEDEDGHHLERLMVGAAAATAVFSYALSDGETVLPFTDEMSRLCAPGDRDADTVCEGSLVGSAIAPVDSWSDGLLCIAIGGTGDAAVVACDDNEMTQRWDGDARSGFGLSVAGIPGGERILIGSDDQTVWIGERGVVDATELPLGSCTSSAEGLGNDVAASPDFWAVGSRGEEVVLVRPDGDAFRVLTVSAGGATTLVVGDLVGDPTPDLVAGGAGTVTVWDGDELSDDPVPADSCADVEPVATLACEDVADRDVACGGDFGASVAVGDVNGDGEADLLVGDPAAEAGGQARAGGVWVYGSSGLGDAPADVLTDSTPEKDAALGRAVAVGPIVGRGEAIAGSDGEVFVFFCTGLSGDGPGDHGLTGSCRQEP